jgi:hypothetical protein
MMLRWLRFLISPSRLTMVLGLAPVFAAYGPMLIYHVVSVYTFDE